RSLYSRCSTTNAAAIVAAVRSLQGIIARLAAIRQLPIRSLYSRELTTKIAAVATIPLRRARTIVAVRIENVGSIRGIAQTITRTLNSMGPSPKNNYSSGERCSLAYARQESSESKIARVRG